MSSTRQLEVLNEVARIASSGLELRPVLGGIAEVLRRSFGWELVACVSIDHREQRFVCEALATELPTEIHVGYTRALGSGVVGEVAATGKPILLDDVRSCANYVDTLPGAQSELCVPVKSGERVIAVLNLESRRLNAFHDQLPLLETVAEQVAGAIANAQLYGEVRRRAGHLELLSEISRSAMESEDLPGLLDRVVGFVHQRLGLSLAALVLIDHKKREIELVSFAGELPLLVGQGARISIDKGIVGRAARTGKPQLVLDVFSDPDYDCINPDVEAELAVPIVFWGEVLGVLNLESTSKAIFSPENQLVLTTLADQVAGALHMATVNRRLGEANRTLIDLFSRYVAPDLAQVLLDDPERFGNQGERREVSVLFADIRGFTALSQKLPSEKVLELLNQFYAAMGEAIFGERGSINRILGDGLMAVFGVPERMDEHERAAVRAALIMQRAAEGLSARWQAAAGVPLRVVVAINAGEVVVGSIGDPRHLAFTVLGDVVNVASRLENEAKLRDARVLVTERVRAANPDVPAESLGEVELRGREGAIAIYRLL